MLKRRAPPGATRPVLAEEPGGRSNASPGLRHEWCLDRGPPPALRAAKSEAPSATQTPPGTPLPSSPWLQGLRGRQNVIPTLGQDPSCIGAHGKLFCLRSCRILPAPCACNHSWRHTSFCLAAKWLQRVRCATTRCLSAEPRSRIGSRHCRRKPCRHPSQVPPPSTWGIGLSVLSCARRNWWDSSAGVLQARRNCTSPCCAQLPPS
mmetsp:Transcript_38127/g.73120  ORF Transcript_38127/g.73120 Transcript_38127/m.73120 type:complete len:206 (-) Transcript_38127:999-1616(-)